MAKAKGHNASSDWAKCNKIFNSLVHLVKKQQIELQYLVKERALLEDRIKLQHDSWVLTLASYKIKYLREFTAQEIERVVEDTKADFITGLKTREAFVYKQKFENSDTELADFREWFDYLSNKCSREKDPSSDVNEKGGGNRLKLVQNVEIDALLAEKNFVWNQYMQMESNLNEQLNEKRSEIESANEKIRTLLASMDKLQSSDSRKDNVIQMLTSDANKLKSELVKKDKEASRLGRELEALKKSMNMTPLLHHCSSHSAITRMKGKDECTVIVKKESESPFVWCYS